ncbi:MAG: hypothetical protein ACR2PZ_02785 [Pseudomonadales bacterium]
MASAIFFRSRLDQAWSDGFKFLRRIPDVTIWKSLSYIESLPNEERGNFFDVCAGFAEQDVLGRTQASRSNSVPPDPNIPTSRQLQLREVQAIRRWTAFPNRFFRQFNEEALRQMVDASRIPAILDSEPPVVAKAGAIRKTLHKRLKTAFNAEMRNMGGGNWHCSGKVADAGFALHIDYGGMGPGFRYSVSFDPAPAAMNGLGFHTPYGIPARAIDFPMADELDDLAAVFCEGITDLHQMYTFMQTSPD